MCFPVLFLTYNLETYRNYITILIPTRKAEYYIYITQAQKPFRNASDLQRSYHNGYLLCVKAKCMNKKIAWRNCKVLKFQNSPVKFLEIPKFQSSKIPKFQKNPINFLEISKFPKFQNSKILKLQNSKILKFQNSKIPKFQISKIPKFQSSKIPKFQNSKIPKFQNSKIPKFQNSKIPKFRNSKIPKFQKNPVNFSEIPKFQKGIDIGIPKN